MQSALSQKRFSGWRQGVPVLITVGACLLAGSCAGFRSEGQGGEPRLLETAGQLRFMDLPIPRGFKFLSSRSCDYERGFLRLCSRLYEGRASAPQVGDFFRSQMPVSNWKLVSEHFDLGERVMNFSKANETCVIRIAARGSKTRLRVSIDRNDLK